jgi:hypothetical protein
MAYRDEKNAVLKQALADLDNKRANVMKLTGIPGKERQRAIAEDEVVKVLDSVFPPRVCGLSTRITGLCAAACFGQAQERVATTRAEYDAMARTVLKEIERFKQEKFQDFRQFLLDFVNLQIVYNKKVCTVVLPSLLSWIFNCNHAVFQLEAEWSSIITDAEAACGESESTLCCWGCGHGWYGLCVCRQRGTRASAGCWTPHLC